MQTQDFLTSVTGRVTDTTSGYLYGTATLLSPWLAVTGFIPLPPATVHIRFEEPEVFVLGTVVAEFADLGVKLIRPEGALQVSAIIGPLASTPALGAPVDVTWFLPDGGRFMTTATFAEAQSAKLMIKSAVPVVPLGAAVFSNSSLVGVVTGGSGGK